MYCDLFHLYPCDHKVNNQRNDNPYGEVKSASTTFTNGSKLGPNTFGDTYKGTSYEPIDEYKGDIARNYFYMVTRYENTVQHWSKNITWGGDVYDSVVQILPGLHSNASPMIDTNSYPVFQPWAHQMLLKWHRLDPVSEKEKMRNQTIYDRFQHNRNPYIDHPELVEYIWGDSIGSAWNSVVIIDDTTGKDTSVVEKPNPDSIFLTIEMDTVIYSEGDFNVSVRVKNASGGVKSVTLYVGATVQDTTLDAYPLMLSGDVYRALFFPLYDYPTLYFTIVAYDNAGNRAVLCYSYSKGMTEILNNATNLPFLLYPNPARDAVYIQLENAATSMVVELIDRNGTKIKSKRVNAAAPKFELQGLPDGIYFVRVITDRGIGVRKFTLAR